MNDNVVSFDQARKEILTEKLRNQTTTCESSVTKGIPLLPDPSYNVIDVRWYTMGRGVQMRNEPIGVVLVEDWSQQYVWAAMGTGKCPQNIAGWGASISKEVAEATFGYKIPDYKER